MAEKVTLIDEDMEAREVLALKEEDVKFLVELGKEIKSQDNMGTAGPYGISIQVNKTERLWDEDERDSYEITKTIDRKNFFLTHEAAQKHMSELSHRYNDIDRMYLYHLEDNPQMKRLIEIITRISDEY